jgi:adenylate kinase family enzyme
VVGSSGSGKTTLAGRLAVAMHAPHLELDAVFHQPGWRPRPLAEFRDEVASFVAGERWVVDGNYSHVQDIVWQRADTVVWIDLPRGVVMRRLMTRSLGRVARRTELWNGNRESLRNLLSRDPERSILVWAWTRHADYPRRYQAALRDHANAHLKWVVVRGDSDVEALLSATMRR